ncbi:MAG: hypothetical protein Q4C95_08775 [Planctomycetia bacterium]|nr:hypothetical protein [Planctomycetia bacterium]
MGIIIQELGGSPKEKYTQDSFTAERTFLLPWDQRENFARFFFGNRMYTCNSELGIQSIDILQNNNILLLPIQNPLTYPDKNSVYVSRINFEPLDADSLDISEIIEPSSELASYKSFAKATVYYNSQTTSIDRNDSPNIEAGTSLTYKMLATVEMVPVVNRDLYWEDNASLPVSEDLMVTKRVPMTEHQLIWKNVVFPPWETISLLQGTVNNATFMGYSAETILFEGAEAYKIYNSTLQNGAANYTWQIRYIFREKCIRHNNVTYGWNHFYRISSPSGWFRLSEGVNKLYKTANHELLFQSQNIE